MDREVGCCCCLREDAVLAMEAWRSRRRNNMREGDGQADNIMAEDEARRWRRSGRMIDSYGEKNDWLDY